MDEFRVAVRAGALNTAYLRAAAAAFARSPAATLSAARVAMADVSRPTDLATHASAATSSAASLDAAKPRRAAPIAHCLYARIGRRQSFAARSPERP